MNQQQQWQDRHRASDVRGVVKVDALTQQSPLRNAGGHDLAWKASLPSDFVPEGCSRAIFRSWHQPVRCHCGASSGGAGTNRRPPQLFSWGKGGRRSFRSRRVWFGRGTAGGYERVEETTWRKHFRWAGCVPGQRGRRREEESESRSGARRVSGEGHAGFERC